MMTYPMYSSSSKATGTGSSACATSSCAHVAAIMDITVVVSILFAVVLAAVSIFNLTLRLTASVSIIGIIVLGIIISLILIVLVGSLRLIQRRG